MESALVKGELRPQGERHLPRSRSGGTCSSTSRSRSRAGRKGSPKSRRRRCEISARSDGGSSHHESAWSDTESEALSEPDAPGDARAPSRRVEQGYSEVTHFCYECWGLDPKGKSLAQVAMMLVGVAHRCPGLLSGYSREVLEQTASKQGSGWKDVLPLPVPSEVAETATQVLETGVFKVKKQGKSGGAIKGAYRKAGIDCLVYCMIFGLNCLWSGLRKNARVHQGPVKASQTNA